MLAIVLAFLFGYAFTSVPLLRSGLALAAVLPIALAADTFSIAVMEIVDNAIILLIPGAMEAGLGDPLFWGSLALALAVAWVALSCEPLADLEGSWARSRPRLPRALVRVELLQLRGEVLLDDTALQLQRRRDLVLLRREVARKDLEAADLLEACEVLVHPLDRF